MSGRVPSASYALRHLIYTTTQQGRHFQYSLLFRWINKVWKHLSKVTNLAMPRWELTLRLLIPSDLIIRLNFEVFLASHSWVPQLPSYLFKETSSHLSWSECISAHCSQMFSRAQAFFLDPIINLRVCLTVHWWNALSPNPALKPWFSGIHGSLVSSFPNCHIDRC